MPHGVRLVLAIHNHQPIGNFDHVCEAACRDSYEPFLDVLEQFPDIPISLHTSGSLLEWLLAHRRDYIERLQRFVERGQIEILGGAFYEPILSGIPRRDRIGQIRTYSDTLEELFGSRPRGMWIPERVWEQAFASDIAEAGIEYTILDDYHFRCAGVDEERLHGYFLTEEEGRLLKVFPCSERLRYTIPFADPQETIDYLGQLAERHPGSVATFGDDGEKFGTWPETHKHVYEDGWLRRFFEALSANRDWIQVATLAEAVDQVPPSGRIYLPDSSYREMTEWALPPARQAQYQEYVRRHEQDADAGDLKQFLRGGFWRNFRTRYAEVNEMYARMRGISERIERAAGDVSPAKLQPARQSLFRGQCNCCYWHGAFGGLYLPHLRHAIFHHLIRAESRLEETSGRPQSWVEVEADDFDLDARKEVRLASHRIAAWCAPARGGHLYELDIRSIGHNLLATLDRRPEVYHRQVRENAAGGDDVGNIRDIRFKQPDLAAKLVYDDWPRKSLVDHFLNDSTSIDDFRAGLGEVGDFALGVYEAVLRRSDRRVELRMSRGGRAGSHRIQVTKTVALDLDAPANLEVRYELSDLPKDATLRFGVEFNFAGMAAGADDRYYYDSQGEQIGQLGSVQNLSSASRIGLVDEWLGLDASLDLSNPADIWGFPIETISQSEGGIEGVHQSCCVIPHWRVHADDSGHWEVTITLCVDTSAAQARQLTETAGAAG